MSNDKEMQTTEDFDDDPGNPEAVEQAQTREQVSFKEAVLDMGKLFREMKHSHGVPHNITLDIVRLNMMFMQQPQQAPQGVRVPDSAPNEVIMAEEFEQQND